MICSESWSCKISVSMVFPMKSVLPCFNLIFTLWLSFYVIDLGVNLIDIVAMLPTVKYRPTVGKLP